MNLINRTFRLIQMPTSHFFNARQGVTGTLVYDRPSIMLDRTEFSTNDILSVKL